MNSIEKTVRFILYAHYDALKMKQFFTRVPDPVREDFSLDEKDFTESMPPFTSPTKSKAAVEISNELYSRLTEKISTYQNELQTCYEQKEFQIQSIYNSRTYRLGHILLYPAKLLRRLFQKKKVRNWVSGQNSVALPDTNKSSERCEK
jgi:hypothetical protein